MECWLRGACHTLVRTVGRQLKGKTELERKDVRMESRAYIIKERAEYGAWDGSFKNPVAEE